MFERAAVVASVASVIGSALLVACSLLDPVPDLSSGLGVSGEGGPSPSDGGDAGPEVGSDAPLSYGETILLAVPVAYYRFGETVGPVAVDARGNHSGTYLAGCKLGEPGVVPDSTAVGLGDADAGIQVANIDFSARAPFSVELWLLARTLDAENRNVFQKDETTGGGRQQFGAYVRAPEGFVFERTVDGTTIAARGSLTTGKFTQVVASYDGAKLALYVNGNLVESQGDVRDQPQKTAPLNFGFDPATGSVGRFDGVLDELAIYDRALLPAEVASHYAVAASR